MPKPTPRAMRLQEVLEHLTAAGELCRPLGDGKLECFACGHRCTILPGHRGVCRVRYNEGGELRVPWGYVAALQLDPIEKKPFFHALPGSEALSFGMLGCDFHCGYCQNWITSQALRDPQAVSEPYRVKPEQLVELAVAQGASSVASTYNEPLITSEWALAIFRRARQAGLLTAYISNGNGTPEVLEYLRPWVDCYKVDLKSFRDRNYRRLGGTLERVLRTVERLHQMGFWVEIVTLVVPGFNDSDAELREMAEFIAGVSPDIPWHVTAFHKDYKMTDPENTTAGQLIRAAEIGVAAGLRYVYAGNLPGQVGRWENTYCPGCGEVLVERFGYIIRRNRLRKGRCPGCGTPIAGIWEAPASDALTAGDRGLPESRAASP